MGTSERKQREREEREELIIGHAAALLLREGFQGLNLDVLAQAIEYAKGTIYQHFRTKEDLVLAVATRALRERAQLFERAAAFTGRSRERMRAVGVACCQFAIAHPDYFQIDLMLRAQSFWEQASPERRQANGREGERCTRVMAAIVTDAQRMGDLPAGLAPGAVSFSLIAMTMGSHTMALEPEIQRLCSLADPLKATRINQDLVCDGLGWRPLLADWDYAATDRRIRAEVFPEAVWLEDAPPIAPSMRRTRGRTPSRRKASR